MGLARIFFHRPKFAVLDEATSAINVDEEGPLYSRLLELGTTVFSIAHRPALERFHQKKLNYVGDGTGRWELTEIATGKSVSRRSARKELTIIRESQGTES